MLPGKRCAFLTMEDTSGWTIDTELGIPPMEALGWSVDEFPWRSAAPNWDHYDVVYIGSPWDYPEDPERFMAVLNSIHQSNATLINDLALVRWSMSKTYLRDLERDGVAIVPSNWHDHMNATTLLSAFQVFSVDKIIVKPIVSTNATDTYLLTACQVVERQPRLQQVFRGRPFVVQPFMQNILHEGEFSLFYFNRVFSHAIQKTPKAEDFRVQEEFGAEIIPIAPQKELRVAADAALALVDPMPVYARVDLVRGTDNRFLIMELELIEPSMYLRTNSGAPRRFAEAITQYAEEARVGTQK